MPNPTIQIAMSVDGSTLTVIDTTTWGVGEYPARDTVALKALAIRKLSTGDSVVGANVYVEESATDISFEVTDLDAVFELYLFAIVLYTGQSTVNGDIVFDPNDRKIKKKIAGVLTEVTLESLKTEVGVPKVSTSTLVITKLTISRDNLELAVLEKLQLLTSHGCEINDYYQAQRDFNYVRSLRSGALIDFARGNYINAQLKIETGIAFASNLLAAA